MNKKINYCSVQAMLPVISVNNNAKYIMKTIQNISKRVVAGISAVCLLSLTLTSCLKDHSNDMPTPPTALLTVFNAIPGASVDFSINQTRVNLSPILYADGIDYFQAYSGKRTFTFYRAGVSAALVSDTATLKQNVAYSLYVVGKDTSPQMMLLTDSISQPSSGTANVRFVNLSPDAPAVDLAEKGGSVIVANKAFKGFSSFAPLAGKTYNFEIRKAGTATVLAAMNNVTISNGYVYTIYLRGLSASTDNSKLTGDMIINAHPY